MIRTATPFLRACRPLCASSAKPLRGLRADGVRRAGGFTLLEVVLTVSVLTLAISTAITAIQSAFLQLDTARNVETAGQIMQCEVEKERLLSWDQLTNAAYVPVIDTSFTRNPAIAGRFTLSRSTALVAQRNNQLLQVTLTVSWRNYKGRDLSRRFTTYIAQEGLHGYFYDNQP